MIKQKYDIYFNTMGTGIIKAAEAALVEDRGRLIKMGFRYSEEYLETSVATMIPGHLPITPKEQLVDCSGGYPGLLDDYLPDAWGRKVLTKLAFYRDQVKLNSKSAIDVLGMTGSSRIGALQWVPKGDSPDYTLGVDFKKVQEAERAAQRVDDPEYPANSVDEASLLYLASAGSGVGGARPKALIEKDGIPYLAKFNRQHEDPYNNARVELACLKMAAAAGINVKSGHIETGVNGREVLMLERFDVCADPKMRKHLVTVNAMIKSRADQSDHGLVFRYDDIVKLIRIYSVSPEDDIEQLIKAMLFNRMISNTDDHERNFSFISDGKGYRLSPSYDMVPSTVNGKYHIAGYGQSIDPPTALEFLSRTPVFGLSKGQCRNAAEEVMSALESWIELAGKEGVSASDIEILSTRIRT